MTKTRAQQQRDIAADIAAQRAATVKAALDGKVICQQCGAMLETVDDRCTAPLAALCDGFVTIELALYPSGRTVDGLCPPEQIARCRAIAGVIA